MIHDLNEQNSKRVDEWITEWANAVVPDKHLEVLCRALIAIQLRTLKTLSSVSLNAILERALQESATHYPLLPPIKAPGISFSLDTVIAGLGDPPDQQAFAAIRFLLIEILSILENLTAGLLTDSLYRELNLVSARAGEESALLTKRTKEREDM